MLGAGLAIGTPVPTDNRGGIRKSAFRSDFCFAFLFLFMYHAVAHFSLTMGQVQLRKTADLSGGGRAKRREMQPGHLTQEECDMLDSGVAVEWGPVRESISRRLGFDLLFQTFRYCMGDYEYE